MIGLLFFFELLSILPVSLNMPLSNFLFDFWSKANSTLLGIDVAENATSDVHVTFNPVVADNNFTSFLQIESIGQGLYTYASLWLILAGVIFLLAMVGPIVLCMSPSEAK
jgi:NADH-ubiquinone oxidoreductase chain 6